jgi:hypothetical protein
VAFNWDKDKPAVVMTNTDAELLMSTLVDKITEAMGAMRQTDLLDQYRQMSRLEAELSGERERNARLASDNAHLQARIAQLNGFLTTMTSGGATMQYPIQTTTPVPVFPDRFSASMPAPVLSLDGTPTG